MPGDRWVLGLDRNTGYCKAVTACDEFNAADFAKYYRSIGYNTRTVDSDGLDRFMEEQKQQILEEERKMAHGLHVL